MLGVKAAAVPRHEYRGPPVGPRTTGLRTAALCEKTLLNPNHVINIIIIFYFKTYIFYGPVYKRLNVIYYIVSSPIITMCCYV